MSAIASLWIPKDKEIVWKQALILAKIKGCSRGTLVLDLLEIEIAKHRLEIRKFELLQKQVNDGNV